MPVPGAAGFVFSRQQEALRAAYGEMVRSVTAAEQQLPAALESDTAFPTRAEFVLAGRVVLACRYFDLVLDVTHGLVQTTPDPPPKLAAALEPLAAKRAQIEARPARQLAVLVALNTERATGVRQSRQPPTTQRNCAQPRHVTDDAAAALAAWRSCIRPARSLAKKTCLRTTLK